MENKRDYYKHDNKSYQKVLDQRYDGQFELIGSFSTTNKTAKIRCLKCGYEFECNQNTLKNISKSEKCPNCLKLKREKIVANRFEKLNPTIIVNNVSSSGKDYYEVTCTCKIHNTVFKRNSKITVESKTSGKPLCPDCIKEFDLQNRINELKAKFPITLSSGIVVNYYGYYINDKKHLCIDCIDESGYKYRIDNERVSVLSKLNFKTGLNRFFKNNPHTVDNINNFLKLKSIPLTLIDDVDCNKGSSKPYCFYCNDGKIIEQKWNTIWCNPDFFINIEEKIANIQRKQMTKERAIQIIREKENELGRPLLQCDFYGTHTSENTVGIRIIWKYWGSFTKMIDELGLLKHDTFYKPNKEDYKSHEDIMSMINNVIQTIKDSGRNVLMTSDFKQLIGIDMDTIYRHCELDNTTLYDILGRYSCQLQRCGIGMNYTFEDGEITVSKYEFDFSTYLRNQGFIYNKNYFRNIRYDILDNEYVGNMNCDYCIDFNGHLLYVELAGILGNDEHQKAYLNNTPIKSKSKEQYRVKLNKKREIFERNNLDYYILLKNDMNEITYKNIMKKYLIDVI